MAGHFFPESQIKRRQKFSTCRFERLRFPSSIALDTELASVIEG